MIDKVTIRYDYEVRRRSLSERGRRLFAAAQVRALGDGGIAAVARASGLAPSTIGRVLKELALGVVEHQTRLNGNLTMPTSLVRGEAREYSLFASDPVVSDHR